MESKKKNSFVWIHANYLSNDNTLDPKPKKIKSIITYNTCVFIFMTGLSSHGQMTSIPIFTFVHLKSPYLSEDIVSVVIYYRKKIFPNIMIDLNRLQTCELAIKYTPCSGHLRSLGDRARHQGLEFLHAGGSLSSFPQ